MPEEVYDRVERSTKAVLGLGSNLGDRAGSLAAARERLVAGNWIWDLQLSSIYESDAVGPEQPDYLNQVIVGRISASPRKLLAICQEIEDSLGRDRSAPRWGPRTIDIDILSIDSLAGADEGLVLPHPEFCRRRFVLVPWAEIDPNYAVPGHGGRTVREFLAALDESGDPLRTEIWTGGESHSPGESRIE